MRTRTYDLRPQIRPLIMASGGSGEECDASVENRTPRPITERFRTAVAMIRSLPKEGPYMADNKTKLRFYALYKQATEGPCHGSKPGFWDVVGKAKWEAWNICGNMSCEIAMQLYVEELTKMVREMPRTTEVTDFLRSITPFFPEREEEGGAGVDQEGEGEEGEGPLSSTVLHRVNDLELSPEREEEGEGGGEGEGGSLSSNDEDYQESFQDLQGTSGELSSPWQQVSPESLSPSFEVVGGDTPHKTLEGVVSPEDPVLCPSTSDTPSGGAGSRITLGRGGSGASGEGVIVSSGGDDLWQSPTPLEAVVREVREVREVVESALRQLQALSQSVQRLVHQFCQPGDTETGQTGSQPVPRRQRRLRRIVHLSLLILGLPLLVHSLITHLCRRDVASLPLWVWSAVSAAHVILSFLLRHWGFPL